MDECRHGKPENSGCIECRDDEQADIISRSPGCHHPDDDGWFYYPDVVPDDRQNVAFVVKSTHQPHLDGKVLGGFYDARLASFSVPGLGLDAYCWRPMFTGPRHLTR